MTTTDNAVFYGISTAALISYCQLTSRTGTAGLKLLAQAMISYLNDPSKYAHTPFKLIFRVYTLL